MIPINDPNLISQLEGTNTLTPVSDPALVAQLEGTSTATNPVVNNAFLNILSQTGALPGINPAVYQGATDLASGISKAGMNLANTPRNIVNLFSPRLASHIPGSPINAAQIDEAFGTQNLSLPGKFTQGIGQFLPFMMAPEALGASGIGTDVASGTAYGGTQSQNPLTGAAEGAALSSIPSGIGLIGKGINYIKPQDLADQIIQSLGQGRSLEENAKSIAQDISEAFANKVQQGNTLYQPVFDAVGNESLELNNPLRKIYNSPSQYLNLDKDIFDSYDRNLNKVNDQFLNNQTFNNAHILQSQLGSAIRKLQAADSKANLSLADRNTLQGYQEAQAALKNDMFNFLNSKDPNLLNQYQSASANWAQNVAPYFDNAKISQMAKGELTNPSNIANIFKSPEPEVQQVVNDLPENSKNKILYSMLGKTSATKTPENLVNAFKQLDQQGLGSYVPQTLAQQISALGTRIKLRNAAQMGGGAFAALGATHPFSGMIPTEMLAPVAAGAGAMLGRGVGGALQKIMPNAPISNSIGVLLSKIYGPSVIPNLVGGQ